MRKKNLTAHYVRSILHYDPNTGLFRHKHRKNACVQWNARWPGKIAGSIENDGYISIGINDRKYQAHRLAFLVVTGRWPRHDLDHRDGNKANNKWNNIREATQSQNQYNKTLQSNNTSGFAGVTWQKNNRKWQAQIRIAKGRRLYLGLFNSAKEAHRAYASLAAQYRGDFYRPA